MNVQLGLGHGTKQFGQAMGGNSVDFVHGVLLGKPHANQESRGSIKKDHPKVVFETSFRNKFLIRSGIQL